MITALLANYCKREIKRGALLFINTAVVNRVCEQNLQLQGAEGGRSRTDGWQSRKDTGQCFS